MPERDRLFAVLLATTITGCLARSDILPPETEPLPVSPACGDGLLDTAAGEACDDGNTSPGDGCDADCAVQAGWVCDPSGAKACLLDSWEEVEPGSFSMGSPTTETARVSDETQHTVTLTRAFSIATTETTQQQVLDLLGWNPATFAACLQCPAEQLSWFDAVVYANELTTLHGGTPCYVLSDIRCEDGSTVGNDAGACHDTVAGGIDMADVALNGVSSVYNCTGFRLPTEAEWEYAARAETTGATYNGELDPARTACETDNALYNEIAWFCGNAQGVTQPGAQLVPNGFGLYDTLGNVWEWCHDWYAPYPAGAVVDPEGPATGTSRTIRGGGWNSGARYVRAAFRCIGDAICSPGVVPGYRGSSSGLRLVRTLE